MKIGTHRIEEFNQPTSGAVVRVESRGLGGRSLERMMGSRREIAREDPPLGRRVQFGETQKSEIATGERSVLVGNHRPESRDPVAVGNERSRGRVLQSFQGRNQKRPDVHSGGVGCCREYGDPIKQPEEQSVDFVQPTLTIPSLTPPQLRQELPATRIE